MKMEHLWSALGCWQTSCMLCSEDEGDCRPPGTGLQCEPLIGLKFLLLCSPTATAEAAAIQGPGEEVRKKKGLGPADQAVLTCCLDFAYRDDSNL